MDVHLSTIRPSTCFQRCQRDQSSSVMTLVKLMMRPDEIATDVGSIIDGDEAVRYGIIDRVGGLSDALDALREMIRESKV